MVINKKQKIILTSFFILLFLTIFYYSFNGSSAPHEVLQHSATKPTLPEKVVRFDESEFNEMKSQITQLNRIVQKNSEIILHLAELSSTNVRSFKTGIEENLVEQQPHEPVSSNTTVKKRRSKDEFVSDTYASISDSIVSSGESPQKAIILKTAIDNIKNSQNGNATDIVFDEGNCSENRCIIQADIANSPFNLDNLNTDYTFKASDDYNRLIAQMSKEVSSSFGEKTNVSYYRAGDRLVMDVKIRNSNNKKKVEGD